MSRFALHLKPHHIARQMFICLALLAVVMRVAVPVGFMPAANSTDLVSLTICLPNGSLVTQHIPLFADQDTHDNDAEHSNHSTCPYGLHQHEGLPMAMGQILPYYVSPHVQVVAPRPSPVLAFVSVRGPPLGSRAPPHSRHPLA